MVRKNKILGIVSKIKALSSQKREALSSSPAKKEIEKNKVFSVTKNPVRNTHVIEIDFGYLNIFKFVRDSAAYRWTMAKEPSTHYWVKRLSEGVKLVYSVPAEVSSLNFSGQNQSPVNFSIGQTLLLGEEAQVATLRCLPFYDLFTTEVGEPRFMRDDHHQWVQVLPLIRWTGHGFWGIFFPQPEFGGVQVIRQGDGECSFFSVACAQRALFGAGTTYTPEQMEKIPYLQNQNLMPKEVVMSIASSFRFQKGFMAPLPIYHNGDTRIPEIDGGIGSRSRLLRSLKCLVWLKVLLTCFMSMLVWNLLIQPSTG